MSKKKNFVLRIDEEEFDALKRWADNEFRSVNGQIEFLLHQSLLKLGWLKETKMQERMQQENEETNSDQNDS